MRKEAPRNTATGGSLKSFSASRKGGSPEAFGLGGVFGRKNENTPRASDKAAARSRGRLLTCSPGLMNSRSDRPATIQPIVPSTRIDGKSSDLGTLSKMTVFERVKVGE